MTWKRGLILLLILTLPTSAWADSGLSWTASDGYKSASLSVPVEGRPGFSLLASEITGVRFTNQLSADRSLTNQIYFNGSGVALGDVDGDGWCDIFLSNLEGANALYRNRGGWRFEAVNQAGGAAMNGMFSSGAALADLDGDGDLDLVVNTVGLGTHLWMNDGRGTFTPSGAPLNLGHGGMSMALADFNGDGSLDLYVANYRTNTLRDMPNTRFQGNLVNGKPTVMRVNGRPANEPDLIGRYSIGPAGGILEHGQPDAFYLNDGRGHFTPVSWTEGTFLDEEGKTLTAPPYDWGLSVMARDLNGDGATDLYVCNDFESPDRIWLNDGKGRFRAAPKFSFRKTSLFSMGVDVADLDRDGFPDIFVADMLSPVRWVRQSRMAELLPTPYQPGVIDQRPQFMRNMLFWNRSDGTYAEIGFFAGVEASEWSWTPAFLDVDLDGYEDLLITNGHGRDDVNIDNANRINALRAKSKLSDREILELRRHSPAITPANVAFRNRGDLTFEEAGARWGFNLQGISQGMALGDLDNDGDLDIVVNNLGTQAAVYRNECSAPRLAIRLKGAGANSRGIGAELKVTGGPVPQSQEMVCGGRYLSSDEPTRVFAAGNVEAKMSIEVRWRSGARSRITEAAANRIYWIEENGARTLEEKIPAPGGPLFENASVKLNHRHQDEPFDDANRQPLMPWHLAHSGPGVAWADLNEDGWDDLIVGSGKGGSMAVFLNDSHGGFKPWAGEPFQDSVTRDQTGWAVMKAPQHGGMILTGGSANYEDGLTNGPAIQTWDPKRKVKSAAFPGFVWSAGPLALGDIAGDGVPELFVGGQAVGGEYPRSASSLICSWTEEGWRVHEAMSAALKEVGLVNGAVFTDLDGDGRSELVLACAWGAVRIFRAAGERLEDVTRRWGMEAWTGWWQGVCAGDFNSDGRMDLAVSNWGLNSRYRASVQQPIRGYAADFDGNGLIDFVITEWDAPSGKRVPVRGRKSLLKALPMLAERVPTFDSYAKASVDELFGASLAQARILEVNTLASMVFLNKGERLEGRAMASQAQWTAGFGISAADFNGDGRVDLFVAGNQFGGDGDNSPLDAGTGALLLGDGQGHFSAQRVRESGLVCRGEQRGSAVADFDRDGRVDLVVGQNSQETMLFHNRAANPGLRIRLEGTAENRGAVGAVARIKTAGQWGPAHELHAGSGFWSQDSGMLVIGVPATPEEIQVRWPGGKITKTAWPAGVREAVVDATGALKEERR